MQALDTSVPVVVLRPDHHGSLCLIRTLGRLGVNVYGVGAESRSAGMMSRYCRDKFLTNGNSSDPRLLVGFLQEVSHKIGRRPILTCTTDVSSRFIAENADALRSFYLFPEIPNALVQSLCDKKLMYFLCKQHKIPTAETLFPQSRQQVMEFLFNGSALFPMMLKGIDGGALEQRGHPRMVIVRNQQELLEKYDQMEDHANPNLMLQEYIPGGDDSVWMFNGYFNAHSECLFGFAGQKIRQHPVYTGATSLGICLRNEIVETTTKNFMKRIGYRGVLDIGYRFDRRTGEYKALDINPRVGATFRLFLAANGMDVVRAMYLDLTGQPVPFAPACEQRKWVNEKGDLISFYDYRRDGKLGFMEWIRSFKGVQEGAWYAKDDLKPFAMMLSSLVGLAWKWLARRCRIRRRRDSTVF